MSAKLPSLTRSDRSYPGRMRSLAIEMTSRQVGLDDLVLQLQGLGLQSFDLIQVGSAGATRIDAVPESIGQVLQVVHLAEQVCLLLAVEQRSPPDTGQVGDKPAGGFDRRVPLPWVGSGIGERISS